MRVLTGGIIHETNTFSNLPTGLRQFKGEGGSFSRYVEKEGVFREFSGTRTVTGGFIEAAKRHGFELVPTVNASATPGGKVTSRAFNWLLKRMLDEAKAARQVEGALLDLHGAMVTERHDDAEAVVLKEVRKILGDRAPIVATLDLHANISEEMVKTADVLVGYDEYPHVDMYERGLDAARILVSMIQEGWRPTSFLCKPPLLPPLQGQYTGKDPMKSVVALSRKIEKDHGVVNVTVACGFPYSDIHDAGIGIVVTTKNDLKRAKKYAKQIEDLVWRRRRDFLSKPTPVHQAVREAVSGKGPVVLADVADNPGAGTPCDGTAILKELLRAKAKSAVVAAIADPEAVSYALDRGVGEKIAVRAGGKTDRLHGRPIGLRGRIRLISNGEFTQKGAMAAGLKISMGRTVILECDGVDVVLTEKRVSPNDLQFFYSLGIDPREKQIVVVKSSVHFRAAFDPIASRIVEVDAPGISNPDLSLFKYAKVRRPIFPLDDL